MNKLIILWWTAALMVSCSPQKRMQKLLSRHPELLERDTILLSDTLITPQWQFDTVFLAERLRDTILIHKENLSIRIRQVHDTVYLETLRAADTVVIQNRVPIERIVLKQPPDNAWHWWIYKAKILLFVLFILAFMALLYLK